MTFIYENAIARIFDCDKHVVGTGFLVTPGYVLTCAHVVLQAIKISKDKFAQYEGQPQKRIFLDFPVLASHQKIEAEVVAWLPFSSESGDVAALRLLTPELDGAKPLPLIEVSYVEVVNERHLVYGFGHSVGGQSAAYQPKTLTAGGRFQLCKFGDPNDETIKPGFSGAPVWNEARQRVVGIVATAIVAREEQQSTAYAIPINELRSVLKQVYAFWLHDILIQSWTSCGSNDEKHRLKSAIDAALRSCDPRGGSLPEDDFRWKAQLGDTLVAMNVDLPPTKGWETEGRLVQFAMMLAKDDTISPDTFDRLETWVEGCNFNFKTLLKRTTREMKQQQVSFSRMCQHLMVVMDPKELSPDEWRVSLWAVPDRETYNPHNPPIPIVREEVLSYKKLPTFLREKIRQKLRKNPTPTIHLFVPWTLFDCNFEMLSSSRLGAVLGSEYPFVVRRNLKTHPIGHYYYDDWTEKWEQLENAFENNTCKVFKSVNCSLPEGDLMAGLTSIGVGAVRLEKCDSMGNLFDLIAEETALPVALWSRDPQFQDQLNTVLDCLVRDLPERIRQERDTAYRSNIKPLLGHHLSLVWEDPKIVPPDMVFDPEAC